MAKEKFVVPADATGRMACLKELINTFNTELEDFKTNQKKIAGNRAKKVLTSIRKLITPVRRDIAAEAKAINKREVEAEAKTAEAKA